MTSNPPTRTEGEFAIQLTNCAWCPDWNNPDLTYHPNGQREHAARRTWSFPEPPDDTVTALRSGADNSLWTLDGERWRYAGGPDRSMSGATRSWPDLLRHYGPLYDATGEQR